MNDSFCSSIYLIDYYVILIVFVSNMNIFVYIFIYFYIGFISWYFDIRKEQNKTKKHIYHDDGFMAAQNVYHNKLKQKIQTPLSFFPLLICINPFDHSYKITLIKWM